MTQFFVAVIATVLSASSFAFECQHVLKEMRLVQLDPTPQAKNSRVIASVDGSAFDAKKKRVALMKKFLDTAPLENQKSFAILMVNYFLDESAGKEGNLLDGMDLIKKGADKNAKPVVIQPNDPTNQILSYISRAMTEDLNDLKGLTVYLLRAKNLKAPPKKVIDFLTAQIRQGDQHFALLQKNCVVGDPTLDIVAAQ